MQTYEGIWRKRQFVPSWVIQCLVSGFFVAVACLALWAASLKPGRYGLAGDIWADDNIRNWLIGEAVYLLLPEPRSSTAGACRPPPSWYSPSSAPRGGSVYLIVAAVATAAVSAALDIILGLLMVITALVQLFYGAKFTHRQRKGLLSHQGGAALARREMRSME
ncbi:hypothetical protein PG997_012943 [Apiospora hydei]|uniref:Uncharacterized protein n=1 Tax=Apiospora hydei TaxID=1337664 RepID=A0ABR1V4S2_9PEZI